MFLYYISVDEESTSVFPQNTEKTLSPYNINRKKPFQKSGGNPQASGFYFVLFILAELNASSSAK